MYDNEDLTEAMNAIKEEMFDDLMDNFINEKYTQETNNEMVD